jgi:phage terminase small subunit
VGYILRIGEEDHDECIYIASCANAPAWLDEVAFDMWMRGVLSSDKAKPTASEIVLGER